MRWLDWFSTCVRAGNTRSPVCVLNCMQRTLAREAVRGETSPFSSVASPIFSLRSTTPLVPPALPCFPLPLRSLSLFFSLSALSLFHPRFSSLSLSLSLSLDACLPELVLGQRDGAHGARRLNAPNALGRSGGATGRVVLFAVLNSDVAPLRS